MKEKKYEELLTQARSLFDEQDHPISSLSNACALILSHFDFFWVGFYLDDGEKLYLGPFQGPTACTTIAYDRGVCGSAYSLKKAIRLGDVHDFPDHIACSELSKSELVIPYIAPDQSIPFVLDIDSDEYNTFDEIDERYLTEFVKIVGDRTQI